MKTKQKKYSIESTLIHGKNVTKKWDFSHHVVPPISSSCTFRLESTKRGALGFAEFAHHNDENAISARAPIYIYDRLGEPNKEVLEENLAAAEHGDVAVTFSTGMAAVSAAFGAVTGTGDEIIAHNILYGCTYSLLTNWYPRYKISTKFVNMKDSKNILRAITSQTRVVYFETPVNPTLELIDIGAIVKLVKNLNKKRAKERKIYIIVDNTFASPYCQRPIEQGVNFVIASLTKNICGFGTDMGGVVIGPKWSFDILLLYRKDFGGALAAKSAWPLLVYGLPSLATRMRQEIVTAHAVASFLENDSRVEFVSYPGLRSFPQLDLAKKQMKDYDGKFAPGSILYFVLKGKTPQIQHNRGEKFINYVAKNAYSITLAVSLGHIRTLIEHPSSMTHSAIPLDEQMKSGLNPGGIRLSVGLEKPADIMRDLGDALDNL
ncbi:MAG: aminotransferase class I/II-fold pyridoxal phosphate-dependent enzyme [Ignavibacteriales bacterium]|nr:aminotransferase class I/II-fold pyridoxal phosphate-dependent enzyme [Ignavibacteriales bacterium]